MVWKLLGNGCDKRFYIELGGVGGYGAICCSKDVAAREMKAHADLKKGGVTLLPDIDLWTDPKGISTEDGTKLIPQYNIQRLHLRKTFKPQMCTFGVMSPVKQELKNGDPDLIRSGLEEIESKLNFICGIVGELTLAIDSNKDGGSGRLYMLDFSPGKNGERAINQIDSIRTGINNLKTELSQPVAAII